MDPTDKALNIIVENMSGIDELFFVNQDSFKRIIAPLIEKYKDPLLKGVEIIKDRLMESVAKCCSNVFDASYPLLEEKIKKVIRDNIDDFGEDTATHLMGHIEAQKSYMNLKHERFVEFCNNNQSFIGAKVPVKANDEPNESPEASETSSKIWKIKSKEKKVSKKGFNGSMDHLNGDAISIASKDSMDDSDGEKVANPIATDPEALKLLILCYMRIVHSTIKDMTPKYLILKLVERVRKIA